MIERRKPQRSSLPRSRIKCTLLSMVIPRLKLSTREHMRTGRNGADFLERCSTRKNCDKMMLSLQRTIWRKKNYIRWSALSPHIWIWQRTGPDAISRWLWQTGRNGWTFSWWQMTERALPTPVWSLRKLQRLMLKASLSDARMWPSGTVSLLGWLIYLFLAANLCIHRLWMSSYIQSRSICGIIRVSVPR